MYSLKLMFIFLSLSAIFAGCNDKKSTTTANKTDNGDKTVTPEVKPHKTVVATLPYSKVERMMFNRVAVRLNLPIFWVADSNLNKAVDVNEIVSLLFYSTEGNWVKDGKFTSDFTKAYDKIVQASKKSLSDKLSPAEKKRRSLVIKDLDQGIPTIVFNDFSKSSPEEKAFIKHMFKISKLIDKLYAIQNGTYGLEKKIAGDDPESRRLFDRNLSTKCVAPKTGKIPECASIKDVTPYPGIYPVELQKGDKERKFCGKLAKMDKRIRKDSKKLLYQFNAVRKKGKKYIAVPYTVAFKDVMKPISEELKKAADEIKNPKEKALKEYLLAASKAFVDNKWYEADKKWVKMNTHNTKWYVRVGPDEVYWDPCNRKAGFHFTFSLINPDSVKWQKKIEPIKNEMEIKLAKLIGKPYRARKIGLHLPDFINIVTNAGNDRSPMGATVGQSLPNWGPVAKKGGRTVVMMNLYTDPDSLKIRREKALSLFTKESLKYFTDEQEPSTFSIILHEITHNLGPAHEYKYRGKKDVNWFGGGLASTLEELKAQTGALWYINLLLEKKIIDKTFALKTYVDSIFWATGHISRGMYSSSHKPLPYSQLAAIQVGFLMKEGAIEFNKDAMAANGKDKGAFILHLDKFPAAINKLMKIVGVIKAKGNKKDALKLIKQFVDSDYIHHNIIKERVLRHPKASFVYSWKL